VANISAGSFIRKMSDCDCFQETNDGPGCTNTSDGEWYVPCGSGCIPSSQGCCLTSSGDHVPFNYGKFTCCDGIGLYKSSESGCCGSGTLLYGIYDGNSSCLDCSGRYDFEPGKVWCCPGTEAVYYSKDDCLINDKHKGDLYCDSNIDADCGNSRYCPVGKQCEGEDNIDNCVEATVPGPNNCKETDI